MLQDSSPLYALVNEGQIVCPIGINIYYNDGEEFSRYLPLNLQ